MHEPIPIAIDRIDDPRLGPFRDLRHGGRSSRRFIAEGRLPVRRLLASDHRVESLLIQAGRESEFAPLVRPGTSLYSLSAPLISELVGFDFHRGVMACGHRRALSPPEDLRFDREAAPIALALIGVTELENVGSLLRSAAAFGVKHVLIGPNTADPYSRRVIRVSMANLFGLTLYDLNDPVAQLQSLHERTGLRSFATTLNPEATELSKVTVDERPMLLIMGNEAEGLDQAIVAACSDQVTIPMRGGTDSLNVSVAAAVFLYALTNGSTS